MTPFNFVSLWTSSTTLMADAQTVISLRLMGMSGILPHRPGENQRMVSEKLLAITEANTEAAKAMLAGKRPDQVMAAGLAPLSRKVRANRKRLTRS